MEWLSHLGHWITANWLWLVGGGSLSALVIWGERVLKIVEAWWRVREAKARAKRAERELREAENGNRIAGGSLIDNGKLMVAEVQRDYNHGNYSVRYLLEQHKMWPHIRPLLSERTKQVFSRKITVPQPEGSTMDVLLHCILQDLDRKER